MILWWIIFALNLSDLALTYYALTHFIGAVEGNPIVALLIRKLGMNEGFAALLIIKVVMQIALLLLPPWCLWVLLAAFAFRVGWNVYQIIRVT